MKHIKVFSSNLESIAYDLESKTLEVQFKGGSRYQYENVPPGTYAGLLNSASKGSFFAQHIKNNFRTRKI